MTTGKTIAYTVQTFVGKAMSLLFNMLSRFLIAFLPRRKHPLISWLHSSLTVILEPKEIKSVCVLSSSATSLRNPMDFSLPGSSVHGIILARVLKWIALSYSNVLLDQRSNPHLLCLLH